MSLVARVRKIAADLTSEEADGARRDLELVQRAGITSVAQLVEAVNDAGRDLAVREIACSLLAFLRERDAAPALARALGEASDAGLAWETSKALIRLGEENVVPELVRVLKQGNPVRQSAAAYALGWLRVSAAIPSLRAAAVNPDLDVEVRGHAIEALGVMQARDVAPDLIALLSDASPEVRYWTAYALGQIGEPASIPELERVAVNDAGVLSGGRSVKEEALDALASIRERMHERPST